MKRSETIRTRVLWALALATLCLGAGCDFSRHNHRCANAACTIEALPDLKGGDGAPACNGSRDCPDDMPLCAGTICRACDPGNGSDNIACGDRNPTTPYCAGGRCVACRAATGDQDCAHKVCDSGICRACRARAECSSGVCRDDGLCAQPSEVVYVDNLNDANCKSAPPTRFCQIGEALTMMPGAGYVRVKGQSLEYAAVKVTDRAVTLVGDGRSAMPRTKIVGAAIDNAAVTVEKNASVVIDGFELTASAMNGSASAAVACNGQGGAATVVVRNSDIHGMKVSGLSASDCSISIDGCRIYSNDKGGIVTGTVGGTPRFDVTNNIIYSNGTAIGGGFGAVLTGSGRFAFNTLFGNGDVPNALGGAVDCKDPTFVIASIVVKNAAPAGSQLGAQCTRDSRTAVSPKDALGGLDQAPDLVPLDYRLDGKTLANKACCIDQIITPDGGFPDGGAPPAHDVDLTGRPVGAGYDVGAHELKP